MAGGPLIRLDAFDLSTVAATGVAVVPQSTLPGCRASAAAEPERLAAAVAAEFDRSANQGLAVAGSQQMSPAGCQMIAYGWRALWEVGTDCASYAAAVMWELGGPCRVQRVASLQWAGLELDTS